jgi:AcrR family transcriptional regulator
MPRRSQAVSLPLSPTRASTPRRGRPPVISDEKILDTARDVFLEHGIRATTAEVAVRARISEGTIFHRFKSKDALFRAAMRFEPEKGPQLIQALLPRVGAADLRGSLLELGNRLLELGRVILPVMMMSWSNPSGEYSLEKIVNRRTGFQQPLYALCAFLQAEMEAGRLARSDVQVLGRAFLGGLRDYCMTELLHRDDPQRPPKEAFVEGLVDLLFRPAPSAAARPKRTRISPTRNP